MVFYFSGTGNSAWVARQMALCLGDSLYSIGEERLEPHTYLLKEGEKVGFIFPVYAWGPPEVVLQFLEQLNFSTQPEYLYFVCTCGDDTGKTAQIFSKVVRNKGWTCCAGFSITMPNTYVSLPGFDVDDADTERIKVTNARSRIQFIADEIKSSVCHSHYNCHEGLFPFFKTYVIRPFFTRYLMKVSPFHVTDTCIGCGKCQDVCPLHNIQLVNNKPQWGDDCAHCLACYHACPKHAIAYGNRTDGKGQYKSEHLR